MKDSIYHSHQCNTAQLSLKFSKIAKYMSTVSLGVLLIVGGGDSYKKNSQNHDFYVPNLEPTQETSTSSELKYYYIQQKDGLLKAIEERYNDNHEKYPNGVLKQYEDTILLCSQNILQKRDADMLIYQLTEEKIEKLGILKEGIIGLMKARYGKDYTDVRQGIEAFENGTARPDLKLVIKFIKWADGSYTISNISVVPNKKRQESISSDNTAEDSGLGDNVA